MAVSDRTDPYLCFNFLVEIDGLVVGGFMEASGLQIEVEVKEYREGGQNDYVHKLLGPVRYPSNLILKHGITDKDELWNWHQEVAMGNIQRRDIYITLLNNTGEETWWWYFQEAYPIRWEGPQLRANANEVAVESLEFVHRGFW